MRAGTEQSRERLVALVLLLERAYERGALSQEEIVRDLRVDEFPVSAKGPRKIPAYQGNETAVRQKFERDKARIRDLGFDIETVTSDDGGVGYRIDPSSAYAPRLSFTPEESRVVALALAFCGYGRSGAFSVFSDVAPGDAGLALSNYYTPVMRALRLRRRLRFGYRSTNDRPREVEPLILDVIEGVAYLVGRSVDDGSIKGYRLSRITSMPQVLPETFDADDASLELARSWRPGYQRAPRPIKVSVVTNEEYATLLSRQYPSAILHEEDGEECVEISFDSPLEAMLFVLDAADRVRLKGPKALRAELREWLKGVNKGEVPSVEDLTFPREGEADVLGQTLQLLHAVYASEEGLRISDLARRFSLEPALVRSIMDRLVSLEASVGHRDGTYRYLASVVKECDDWDDEENDDSLYVADYTDLPDGHDEPPIFMWRDLFELNIALREASRISEDPAIDSAIEKIEALTSSFMQIHLSDAEAHLLPLEHAIEFREQLKIEYEGASDDASQVRTIEPRELRVLNGHSYVRAFCATRGDWRTFRVDRIRAVLAGSPATEPRPTDTVKNWLTRVGEEGGYVVVALAPSLRWHFEALPGAAWATLPDGRLAVRFRVSDERFLDRLMVRAGPGAVVATPEFASAGRELARRLRDRL